LDSEILKLFIDLVVGSIQNLLAVGQEFFRVVSLITFIVNLKTANNHVPVLSNVGVFKLRFYLLDRLQKLLAVRSQIRLKIETRLHNRHQDLSCAMLFF
jgi:hypothetical protein